MVYIPHVPAPPTPSARARELGSRLVRDIAEYRARTPDLQAAEVQQALQIAAIESASAASSSPLRAVAAALVALLALFIVEMLRTRGSLDGPVPAVLAVVIVLLLGAGLLLFLRSR